MDKRCDACAFYMADADPITGECRRYAPRVTLLGDVTFRTRHFVGEEQEDHSVEGSAEGANLGEGAEFGVGRAWPAVIRDDWCGEWVARGEPGDPRRSVGYVEGTGSRPRVELVSGWRPLVGRFLSPGSILQHRDGSRVQLLRRKDDDSGWWLAPPDGGLDDRMIRKTGEWFLVSVIDTPPPPPEQTSQRSTEP